MVLTALCDDIWAEQSLTYITELSYTIMIHPEMQLTIVSLTQIEFLSGINIKIA